MAGELLLGIDIGTASSKGVLCTPDGRELAVETVEHGEVSRPRPGWAEHDAEKIWWGDCVELSRRLLAHGYTGDDVGGIAVSAIGACLLPVNVDGEPLRQGILYGIDTRASAEIEILNDRFGKDALLQFSGMALTSQAIGPKILWLQRHEPDVYTQTHKFLTASSYLVQRLTGEFVIDRHTASYFNPLIDLRNLEWDERFAEPIVDLDRLPRLMWSDEIAGQVQASAAAVTGLRIGTPVTVGTVDAAAEAISVGVVEPGDMMVMYGSTMFFILVSERPVPDPSMWATAFCFPGSFDVAGGLSTSGALTKWFRDELAWGEKHAQATGGANAYAALADLAAATPLGAEGLICLPYFSGERTPIQDPEARGVFAGLTLSHTRGHLYRAVLEGTAFGVRHNLEVIEGMGVSPRRLVAVGGGAKNPLWLQIVSDVTGVTQDIPERTIGAALGDAYLAGIATGIISDRASLHRDWVRIARRLEPDSDRHAAYHPYYKVYRDLYENAKEQLHQLARLGATKESG